ncbi:S-layer homology domain-containing protein [Thermoanaerobacterium sp. DL9XJH110]|uniref:S-layer homology domain-containing protein n=1 Tax=Thermoanaerobacterium sp. DL9XJH110 TaxID=3386643 RepID=UPI003BB5F6B5
MKKAKKLLVTLLVLTFVLSTMSVGFAADNAQASNAQSPEVVRAQALGILRGDEKGNLNLDKPITRAEALALVIRISGLEGSAELMKGQTKFTDVAATHWASGYINLGVGQGIIKGYPDGTFKPSNNVTYAEMAKMLLYAMNYGVTVEGAPWPAGVMGKADDLGLFDNVNATPNVPALRGDVVKMIDNSLTVKHLKQTGYGDLKSYEESDTTFLSKLKVKEIDGRVTAVDAYDYKVTVDPIDNDQPITKATTYTVLDKTVDIESLLGVEVTVWVNNDDEIFFIDPNWDDVKVDVISSIDKDANKIKLKIADKTYKLAKDYVVYKNGESADIDDLLNSSGNLISDNLYGTFVFDGNEVVAINVKYFNKVEAGLVESVDDNIITYYDGSNEVDIDLEDPSDGYVITLNGKTIQPDDIKPNDVIYVADYNDMYHIVVVRNTVSGELERVKAGEVKIKGTTYDVIDGATFSPDENDNIYDYSADDSKLEDMLGQDTTAILDIAGDVRHLMSSVETTSDTFYGVLLKVDDYNEVVKVNVAGSSKSYNVDADIANGTGKAITVNDHTVASNGVFSLSDLKALVNDSADKYAVVSFTLDKDGVINDMTVYAIASKSGDSWNVDSTAVFTVNSFDKNDDTISAGSKRYIVNNDTIIIDELDDIDVVKWDNIKDKTWTNTVKAIIVSDGNKAKLVVFTEGFTQIQQEDKSLGVVLDKYKDKDGDWAATVSVYSGKEVDYKLKSSTAQNIGDVVLFSLNSDNKLTVAGRVYQNSDHTSLVGIEGDLTGTVEVITGYVTAKSSSSITVNGTSYALSSKTLYFDVTDGYDSIDTAAYRDIKTGTGTSGSKVTLIVDQDLVKIVFIEE